MRLFLTWLQILWQPGGRKQLYWKKQFLLRCRPTTPHCLQSPACPKEQISDSNLGSGWDNSREANILLIFTVKNLTFVGCLSGCSLSLGQETRSIASGWGDRTASHPQQRWCTPFSHSGGWQYIRFFSLCRFLDPTEVVEMRLRCPWCLGIIYRMDFDSEDR